MKSEREKSLEKKIELLESEIEKLKAKTFFTQNPTVKVFDEVKILFESAEKAVADYFNDIQIDPSKAKIEIQGQRYVLMRASSLSVDFFNAITELYDDKGKEEAFKIGQQFLFDISHVIGIKDAINFNDRVGISSHLDKLSAGPIHFAYSGWAFVELLPDSNPSPDESFFLHYNHPYSFEADSWINSDIKSVKPVCIMNSGYSSGWCEESFGFPLTAVELSCRACGDDNCTFIMAPPHKINEYLEKHNLQSDSKIKQYDVPSFFLRKEIDEKNRIAKEKAEASDKLKTEFLANMSHEIRTPLNTIVGYTDLLKNEDNIKKKQEYLGYIKNSTDHILRLINDILDLSKINAGQLLVNRESFYLKEFFESLYRDISVIISSKNKKLNLLYHIDDNCPEIINSDILRLKQILLNLLSNAVKFTEKGNIEFGVNIKDEYLEFFVKDSGIGIDNDKFQQIFETFKQVDSTISRKYGGTGLGLSISKRLTEILGGSIRVVSELNKGSCFYVTLPITKGKIVVPDKEVLKTSPSSKKIKILLAEDNIINLKLLEMILNKAGFEVFCAKNGSELLNLFLDNLKADIIITDIQMPVMDGIELIKYIRKIDSQSSTIPIIALTANAMNEDKEIAISVGANAYLTKPINPTEIINTIELLTNE